MTEAAAKRRLIYLGAKFNLALEAYQSADGTPAERELIIHPGAVALVPLVDNEHVCLVENERYAAGKTLLEVPAGTIDAGEVPGGDSRKASLSKKPATGPARSRAFASGLSLLDS